MSSHLSINYAVQSAASTAPAATTVAGAVATVKAAADNPLGFLAALVDQLTAGAAADTTAPLNPDATTGAQPAPAFLNVDASATTSTTPAAQGASLLATLSKQLDALKAQLDNGDKPDPDLLKRLADTVNAIAALLTTPLPPATPVADASTATPDPLLAATAVANTGASAAVSPDDATSLFASLASVTAPASSRTDSQPAPPGPTSTEPLPALAALSDKLADLVKTLTPVDPATARQLGALTPALTAAQTSPQVLGSLAGSSDPSGVALDASLQRAVNPPPAAPAATQQFAATPPAVPEALVAPRPKDRDPTPAQPAAPSATAATDSTPPATPQVKVDAVARVVTASDTSKSDAKIVAAATAAAGDAKDTDAADPAAAQVAAATTTAAPQAAARALPAVYAAAQNPINMGQVAFEMMRQMHQGASRFTIRLDPPELGRVDVHMHVDSAGAVSAKLTVERSETLDMFQRDRGSLEKALSQAGLDSSKTNLEFSLKQQNSGQNAFAQMAGGDQRQAFANSGARYAQTAGDSDDAATVPLVNLYRGTASAGGVNLFV